MILLPEQNLEEIPQCVLHMCLYEAELLIALIFQNFGKQSNLVIISQVHLDRVNDRGCPLDDQRLQPILLIEVGIHELLHGLDGQARLAALRVIFDFLLFHITNDVFQLFEGKNLDLRTWPTWQGSVY